MITIKRYANGWNLIIFYIQLLFLFYIYICYLCEWKLFKIVFYARKNRVTRKQSILQKYVIRVFINISC